MRKIINKQNDICHVRFSSDNIAEDHFFITTNKSQKHFQELIDSLGLSESNHIFSKFFLRTKKDFSQSLLFNPSAQIIQPPIKNFDFIVLSYFQKTPDRPYFTFLPNQTSMASSIYDQTYDIFSQMDNNLQQVNQTFAQNALRSWIYINNIDMNYQEMSMARNSFFEKIGLGLNNHFIASTGIEGTPFNQKSSVSVDLLVANDESIINKAIYMEIPDDMPPTHQYQVSFERGTIIHLPHCRHFYISGTASIDKLGNILYPKDVCKQALHASGNVQKLLEKYGATISDLGYLIIYLRNKSDYEAVYQTISKIFSNIPTIFLEASVCRPGWLIEIEGHAIR